MTRWCGWQAPATPRPRSGRSPDAQITIFDTVLFALEDFSALRNMRDAAGEMGLGSPLDLVPQLGDPKDLFATVGGRCEVVRCAA